MLQKQFRDFILSNNLFTIKDRLLLAVSGGVDSVVLCALCKNAGYDFIIAHCNFQLRGEESERDEQFVRSLGEQYGVEVLVKKFDTAAVSKAERKSIETTARDLRYQWFYDLLNGESELENPLQYIVTAHHADDNIETSVMNFFRGTGIAGIRGMQPKQGKIVRPLLFARRAQLESFTVSNQLSFVTDASNFENDYTRNFFRNKILPMVAERYPETQKNVLNNLRRFNETEQLYQQAVALHKKNLLEQKGNEVHIPVLKLQKVQPVLTILYEIIKDYGFTAHQTEDALALLSSETGKYVASATHRIIKNRNWLIISPVVTEQAGNILIEAIDEQISFPAGVIRIEKLPAIKETFNFQPSTFNHQPSTGFDKLNLTVRSIGGQPSTIQLDSAQITFPLLLRKWKAGDYFYPLGMQKKKKLSRFFTDQKLSLTQRENAWVMEMDKKIIWVVGMRIDDRFKLRASTQDVIQFEIINRS